VQFAFTYNPWSHRDPSNIMSRMISSDHRSPSISTDAFSGQPDRRFGIAFLGAISPD